MSDSVSCDLEHIGVSRGEVMYEPLIGAPILSDL